MTCRRLLRTPAGFTLIEVIVVVLVLGIAAGLGFPTLLRVVHQVRVTSHLREASALVQQARLEAIRRGAPVVVEIDADTREMFAYADLNGENPGEPSNGEFDPQGAAPPRTTDYEFRRLRVRGDLAFEEPGGQTGLDSLDGFVNPNMPDQRAIFQSDGSLEAAGAFRFADARGNFLEIRIAPAATGKVQIRKYDPDLGANWDGTHWYAHGEVSKGWKWK